MLAISGFSFRVMVDEVVAVDKVNEAAVDVCKNYLQATFS